MMSKEHEYRGKTYVIERDVEGWRIWHCYPRYLGEWKKTRKEAVEDFQKWVDSRPPVW